MSMLLLAILVGCSPDYTRPSKPAASYTDPGLAEHGPGNTLNLAPDQADLELPDRSRAGPTPQQTRWELTVTEDPLKPGRFQGDLPIGIGNPRGYPPVGIQVSENGRPVPYGTKGRGRWSGAGRHFELRWGAGQPKDLVVEWPNLVHRLSRLAYADSGLEPAEFVRWSATRHSETRQGLLLPAPASASWTVDVPSGDPRFQTWLVMEQSPLSEEQSSGAEAVLEVVEDGKTTEVARSAVDPKGARFESFEASLASWAGKQVTLRLRTEPGADNLHDYVFLGSPQVWGQPARKPRRIVVIGLDTTRPDHFGLYGYDQPTSPEMDAVAAHSAVFDDAWTPAPRTRPSFRSATTGRNPLDAVGATNIGEVFHDHGWATGGFVANVHLQPRFGFHEGFDRWVYDNGGVADSQLNRALTFMRAHSDQDTYVFVHLLDPHNPYIAPGNWRNKFVTVTSDLPERQNRWDVYSKMKSGSLTEDDKTWLVQRYDSEIAYTSYQLGRFFHELDAMGDQTLVVVHSDHGEEFWEHGQYEHNHALYRDVTKAFLVVRPGTGFQGGRRIDVPVTLYDIAPTVFDYAGIPEENWPELDGRSLRPLVAGEPAGDGWERDIGVGHLRYGHEQWGVVSDGHKYILHTGSGKEELYDLSSDPGEHLDLVPKGADLGPFRNALADIHKMPVCPGIRVQANVRPRSQPVAVELPAVPLAVEILDPERVVEAPTNQAWGQPPSRSIDEIGRIEWEPGSSTFTWKPGKNPRLGQIFVFYDQQVPVDGVVVRRGEDEPLELGTTNKGLRWTDKGQYLVLEPGVVLSPPPGEATRMRALAALETGDAGGDDLAMLQELGYLGDDHEHGQPEPADEAQDDPDEPTGEESDEPSESSAPPAARGALKAQACRW